MWVRNAVVKMYGWTWTMGFLLVAMLAMGPHCSMAQTNPYRLGSPHYWMAEATLGINAGRLDVAYTNLQKAAVGYKNIGDVASEANALGTMGKLKAIMGEWSLAQQYFQKALGMAKETNDEGTYSKVLMEVLPFCKGAGYFDDYNRYVGQFDSLRRESQTAMVNTLYHAYWSNEYVSQHEYAMAEHHMQLCWDALQGLPLMERENAKQSYYYVMMNLAQQQNDYPQAVGYAKKYVAQTEVVNGRNSSMHLQAYNLLARLYTEAGARTDAFAVLDSLRRGVGLMGQDDAMLATYHNSRGFCYAKFGDYDKAIECFDKSLALLRDRPTEDTPSKFESYNYKAEALFRQRRFDEAYDTFLNSVETYQKKFGSHSSSYCQALSTLATVEAERGNISRADSLYGVSLSTILANLKPQWSCSTPSQHEQYWKDLLNRLSGVASFVVKYNMGNDILTEMAYNALLFTKALLLESEKTMIDVLVNEGTESDIENYRRLMALNSRLMSLRCNYKYNKGEIDSLVVIQRDLEQQLTNKCQLYSDYNSYLDVDYQKVKDQLREGEVLVDFSDFQTDDSLRQYVAYVVEGGQKSPVLVKCFVQEQLDTLLGGAPNYAMYDYEQFEDGATDLLWKPLGERVPEGATIYYVPSGVMHNIALESLPLPDGSILGQHYRFVRLSSAREIDKLHNAHPMGKTATLYGGLEYDLSTTALMDESHAYAPTSLSQVFRSGYGTMGFGKLKKSKEEVEVAGKMLRDNGYEVSVYSGSKGNAESFVAMSGHSPAIIHLATHGFYYTPTDANKYDYLRGYTDAMSLSGLVFAGGNAAWLGREIPAGVLGGILSARDISNLNLKGTDLVVLSACKTAQGNVTAEGLYGLQRAFKKAGAGTLVLTLWRVRDSVAQTFATTFYKELIAQGGDKRRAFDNTKAILRKKYDSPFDWACFVMVD